MKYSRIASFLLTVCLMFGIIGAPVALFSSPVLAEDDVWEYLGRKEQIGKFVDRLYSVCLGREADESGSVYWSDLLIDKKATGISCAYGFVFSDEFINKKCSNADYVGYMYDAFFGRTPAASEVDYWVSEMKRGKSRVDIFTGFANSPEFAKVCEEYGVIRGDYIPGKDIDQTVDVNLFVDRLYKNILERDCDAEGMTYWTHELLNKTLTGAGVAQGFIFSPEFTNKNLCNDCYIKVLYKAFMGREYDQAGLDYWVKCLSNGESREMPFNGYVASDEFTRICEKYGILRGEPSVEGNTFAVGTCSNCGTKNPELPATNYKVGEKISYGSYGGEDISWIILDRKGDDYLVLSEKILDASDFTSTDFNLERWLANDFYQAIFTDSEKANINQTEFDIPNGGMFSTTYDTELRSVFLLTPNEVEEYMPDKETRIAYPSDYAMSTGKYGGEVENGAWCWWTREKKYFNHGIPYDLACYVKPDGSIPNDSMAFSAIKGGGVRPAMWINLKSVPNPIIASN